MLYDKNVAMAYEAATLGYFVCIYNQITKSQSELLNNNKFLPGQRQKGGSSLPSNNFSLYLLLPY